MMTTVITLMPSRFSDPVGPWRPIQGESLTLPFLKKMLCALSQPRLLHELLIKHLIYLFLFLFQKEDQIILQKDRDNSVLQLLQGAKSKEGPFNRKDLLNTRVSTKLLAALPVEQIRPSGASDQYKSAILCSLDVGNI